MKILLLIFVTFSNFCAYASDQYSINFKQPFQVQIQILEVYAGSASDALSKADFVLQVTAGTRHSMSSLNQYGVAYSKAISLNQYETRSNIQDTIIIKGSDLINYVQSNEEKQVLDVNVVTINLNLYNWSLAATAAGYPWWNADQSLGSVDVKMGDLINKSKMRLLISGNKDTDSSILIEIGIIDQN